MSETFTASDLEKAHVILSEFGLLIGPAGKMSDVIARAIAAGIALGRKEALIKARRRSKEKPHDNVTYDGAEGSTGRRRAARAGHQHRRPRA